MRRHTLLDECRILLVHGLLHLLGHDHEAGAEGAGSMERAERLTLGRLGWRVRSAPHVSSVYQMCRREAEHCAVQNPQAARVSRLLLCLFARSHDLSTARNSVMEVLSTCARMHCALCLVYEAMPRPPKYTAAQGDGLIAAAGSSSSGDPPADAGGQLARLPADSAESAASTSSRFSGGQGAGQAALESSPSAEDTGAVGRGAGRSPAGQPPAAVRPDMTCIMACAPGRLSSSEPAQATSLRRMPKAPPYSREATKAPQGFGRDISPLQHWTRGRR